MIPKKKNIDLKDLMILEGLGEGKTGKEIARSFHEDIVRKSAHGLQNILSMAFKRK